MPFHEIDNLSKQKLQI